MRLYAEKPVVAGSSAGDVSGFILAGGQSSRMGTDKALVKFAGSPLIQHALKTFADLGVQARVAGSRSNLSTMADVISDTFQNAGPMSGIHAGLSDSRADWNIFLPVDMPLIPASLLARLLQRAQVTGAPVAAAKLAGRLEPFPVVLHRSTLPHLTRRLQNGQTAGHAAWHSIPGELEALLDCPSIENLIQCGQVIHPYSLSPSYWFLSANTQEDLALLDRVHCLHFR